MCFSCFLMVFPGISCVFCSKPMGPFKLNNPDVQGNPFDLDTSVHSMINMEKVVEKKWTF